MPVSDMAGIPSGISSHHQTHPGDNAKYEQKYKKLKQLVKETIFVSDVFMLHLVVIDGAIQHVVFQ